LFQVAGRRLEAGCVLDRRATIEQAPPVFTPAKNMPAFLGGMLADPAHDEAAVKRYSPTLGRAPIRSGPPGGAPSFVYRRTPFVRISGLHRRPSWAFRYGPRRWSCVFEREEFERVILLAW